MQMEDEIFQVMIPTEIVRKRKDNGTFVEKEEKIYPGYVFIEMLVTDNSWFVVRNTPGVTGFLGSSGGGTKPVPLPAEEILPILKRVGIIEEPEITIAVGDQVRINSGSYIDQIGKVDSINLEKRECVVLVEWFGRETPLELSVDDVQKVY